MSRILWGVSKDSVQRGVKNVVLYPGGTNGFPWNGVTSIVETVNDKFSFGYIDGEKVADVHSSSDFSAKITSYGCPETLKDPIFQDDIFGLSYITNDISSKNSDEEFYDLHLVYNAVFYVNSLDYKTINPTTDITKISWGVSTTPLDVPGYMNTSHLIIRSRFANPFLIEELNHILYGSDDEIPRLPTPTEIIEFFNQWVTLIIHDHGDGIFTAIGPDDVVYEVEDTVWTIEWDSVIPVSSDKYQVSSL